MKQDISKILLGDTRNPDYAKGVSMKIYAIQNETRNDYIKAYCELCRLIFIYKFIYWRLNRLKEISKPVKYTWENEIPQIKVLI